MFEQVYQEAPDAVLMVDAQGFIVDANRRAVEAFGYSHDELTSERVELLIPDSLRERHTSKRRDYFGTPRIRAMGEQMDLCVLCKDGTELPVDIMLSPISTEDGELVLAVVRDTSAQKRTRRNVHRLLNAVPDSLVICDTRGRIQFVNAKTEEIFRYGRGELSNQAIEMLVPERFREVHVGHRRGYLQDPRSRRMADWLQLYGRRKDGSEFPLEISLRPLRTSDGLLVACAIRDISDRWAAEEALRQSESRYRLLAQHASDVIYTMDFDLKFKYISPSVLQQRGWTVEEMMVMPLDRVLTPASLKASAKALSETLMWVREKDDSKLRSHRVLELESYCKDGSILNIETKLSIIFDENGKPAGILGVSRDVSHRKKMEKEKATLEGQLHQAQKMEAIGTLAGGVAHDFNNLLMGILGHIDLMKMKMSPQDSLWDNVEIIERAAHRAEQLTSQLLGFARKGKFQIVEVDLNEAIEDVVSFLDHTMDKKIKLNVTLWDDPVVVFGDPGQINQVLLNLAVNARDAMPDGGALTFETRVVHLDEEFCKTHFGVKSGQYALMVVSDTGLGMSRETRDRIFEPFFSAKPAGTGTGMGLAMVYGVVKNHNGIILVDSEPNQGATFQVYLPYLSGAKVTRDSTVAEKIAGMGCILVVDDEGLLRDVVCQMLESLGYTTIAVESGAEAIAYFKSHWEVVDAVILDMIMPGMSGSECLKELRDIHPNVRVVMTTGYTRQAAEEYLDADHVTGFIQKPYRVEDLSEVMATVLSHP